MSFNSDLQRRQRALLDDGDFEMNQSEAKQWQLLVCMLVGFKLD